MTRQMVDAMQTKDLRTRAGQTKGRREPAFVRSWVAGGASVARGCRTAPAKAVVHADRDGMLVLPAADADNVDRTGGDRRAAEVVILVLGLGRPVRREHVFEASANGIAVLAVAGGGEGLRDAGDIDAKTAIAPGITALGVKQRRSPGVADATGHRAELVGIGGHLRAQRERSAAVVGRQPGILGLDTHDPIGRELVVEAALNTAEEARVARLEAAVAGKGAADMAADVEAGPVVDHLRRRVGRSLGVGARLHVGCGSRRSQRKQGNRAQQNPLHDYPRSFNSTLRKQRGVNWVASRRCRNVDRSLL